MTGANSLGRRVTHMNRLDPASAGQGTRGRGRHIDATGGVLDRGRNGMNWRRRELGATVIATVALAVMIPAGGAIHAQPAAPAASAPAASAPAAPAPVASASAREAKRKAKAEAKPGYILPADPV